LDWIRRVLRCGWVAEYQKLLGMAVKRKDCGLEKPEEEGGGEEGACEVVGEGFLGGEALFGGLVAEEGEEEE
jgi:hypothetical protein